jgi:hypothetical protein
MAFESWILLLVILILVVVIIMGVVENAEYFIVNTLFGLIILALSNLIFKLDIPYSIPAILICALGGIPGALLVILLHVLGIAF